jgi:hypothetical protein
MADGVARQCRRRHSPAQSRRRAVAWVVVAVAVAMMVRRLRAMVTSVVATVAVVVAVPTTTFRSDG